MTQGPWKVDGLQIEPSSGDSLKILRDGGDGSLTFEDAVISTPIKLKDLVSLQKVSKVHMVGPSGNGVTYNTIQAALNQVSATASKLAPELILLFPGEYVENIVWEKNGVILYAFGGVKVTATTGNTIEVRQGASTTPKWGKIHNLWIENTNVAGTCLKFTGGAGSEVAVDRFSIHNCEVEASGNTSFCVDAQICNHLEFHDSFFGNSHANSIFRVQQCSTLLLRALRSVPNFQLDYDTGGSIPNVAGTSYLLDSLISGGPLISTRTGAVSLDVLSSTLGNVTLFGDQMFKSRFSEIGNLVVNNTVFADLLASRRGTASGSGTLREGKTRGTASFAAVSFVNVVFGVNQPDTNYVVLPESPLTESISVTNQAVTGFTLSFSGVQTTAVNYMVLREM